MQRQTWRFRRALFRVSICSLEYLRLKYTNNLRGDKSLIIDEADDGETAGGDGDKMDEEESGGREGDGADEGEIRKKSAVYLHLLSRPDCLSVYDDSHFSVLCRARYVQQLKVLEAVCIRTHKPDLCKQKEHVLALRLFS